MQQLLVALPDLQPEAERGRKVVEYWTDYSSSFPNTAHPDKADRFGRVWVWHHGDTYIHDGAISCPENLVMSPSMQLPNRKLRGNPNYAGLCEICTSEW